MIGIFIVVFIAVVSIIRYFISDYDKCYSERERSRWIRDIRLLQRNGRWNKADQLSF